METRDFCSVNCSWWSSASFKLNHALISLADREILQPYHQHVSSETILLPTYCTTLLLSMPWRRVDPAVVGVALVYPSPSVVACCRTSLLFTLFLSKISIYPQLPLFALLNCSFQPLGRYNKMDNCRCLNAPFVANSTPYVVNVLQDVVN